MLTYDQIIHRAKRSTLNLGTPRLRLLPPPGITAEDALNPLEVLAWAKARANGGRRFRGIPITEPTNGKRTRGPDHARRADAYDKILAALPASIGELIAVVGLSKPVIHKRLLELQLQRRAQPIRRPGRGGANTWHVTTPAPGNDQGQTRREEKA